MIAVGSDNVAGLQITVQICDFISLFGLCPDEMSIICPV